MVEAGWFMALPMNISDLPLVPVAVAGDQVAHGVIADVGKAHGAQARLDRLLDELLEQRLVFQQLGLRARDLDELDQEFLGALARQAWHPAVLI